MAEWAIWRKKTRQNGISTRIRGSPASGWLQIGVLTCQTSGTPHVRDRCWRERVLPLPQALFAPTPARSIMPQLKPSVGPELGIPVVAEKTLRLLSTTVGFRGPGIFTVWLVAAFLSPVAWGVQEPNNNYWEAVVPLLADKCLKCHQASRAEGDFRIDDADQLAGYVVGGNLEESPLWTEHLAEDASNPMPPEDENDPWSAEQRAVIRTWIEAGGQQEAVADWQKMTAAARELEASQDLSSVLWTLHGRLHPAVLHFPVALISVAALFALLAFGNTHMDKAAMYCLGLGTLGACVAVSTGWGFAEHKQWGDWETELGNQESWWETLQAACGSSKFMHRWGGVVVAGLSILVFLLAFISRLNPNRSQFLWKASLVLLAGLVGFVGHLGGKLSHGDLYSEPLTRLQEVLTAAPDPGAPAVDNDEQTPKSTDNSEPSATAAESAEQQTADQAPPTPEKSTAEEKQNSEESRATAETAAQSLEEAAEKGTGEDLKEASEAEAAGGNETGGG